MRHNQTMLGHTLGRDYSGQLCSASVTSCLFPKISNGGKEGTSQSRRAACDLTRDFEGTWTSVQVHAQVCMSVCAHVYVSDVPLCVCVCA